MKGRVFIAVAGNIGSGKTTLTRRLVKRLGFTGLYEDTRANPYLEDFYRDMPRYALPLQLRFLAHRVETARATLEDGISAIQDRTCWEDAEIFAANLHARGALDDRDWETYRLVAAQLLAGLEAPDLLVYLRRSAESCRALVAERGRSYERAMPAGYLEDLAVRYDRFFDAWGRGPKLRVEAEAYDFLYSEGDLDAIVGSIAEALPQPLLPFG